MSLMLEKEARLLEKYRDAYWKLQKHKASVKDPTTLIGLAYERWYNELDILDRSQWVARNAFEDHVAKLCAPEEKKKT